MPTVFRMTNQESFPSSRRPLSNFKCWSREERTAVVPVFFHVSRFLNFLFQVRIPWDSQSSAFAEALSYLSCSQPLSTLWKRPRSSSSAVTFKGFSRSSPTTCLLPSRAVFLSQICAHFLFFEALTTSKVGSVFCLFVCYLEKNQAQLPSHFHVIFK